MGKKFLLLSGFALVASLSGQALAQDGPGNIQRAADIQHADRNRDGMVTLREAVSYWQSFRQVDRNGDGVLSTRELRRAGDDLAYADTNRDGRVSYYERQAAFRAQFARLDRNRDGVISGREMWGAQAPRRYGYGSRG